MTAKLTYADKFSCGNGGASYTVKYFCANGMYDPNVTGTGHQPLLFDQYMALYHKYAVTSSRISVRPIQFNTNSYATSVYYGILMLPEASNSPTTIDNLIEQLTLDKRSSGPQLLVAGTLGNNNYGQRKAWCNYNAVRENGKRFFSEIPDNQYGDATTNPNGKWYFAVVIMGAGDQFYDGLDWEVNIEYTSQFLDRHRVTSS